MVYIDAILVQNLTSKKVSKISYWYLDRDNSPKEAVLDSLQGKVELVLTDDAFKKQVYFLPQLDLS